MTIGLIVLDQLYEGWSDTSLIVQACSAHIAPSEHVASHVTGVSLVTRFSSQAARRPADSSSPQPLAHRLPATSIELTARSVSGPFVPPSHGAYIVVYWPKEQQFYLEHVQHLDYDGRSYLMYEDGDQGWLNPADERWHYCS